MDASLIKLYSRGLVTMETAQTHMRHPQSLLQFAVDNPNVEKKKEKQGNVFKA